MTKIQTYIYLTILSVAMLIVAGCRDDLTLGKGVIDGSETIVDVAVGFDAQMSVDLTATRSSGTAMQDIDSFWMVFYDSEGNLIHRWHILENGAIAPDAPENVSNLSYKRADNRLPEEGELQDSDNGRLDFKLAIATGRYHIYGVSNFTGFDLLSDEEIATPELLKGIRCQWDSENPENNRQMFGIFTLAENRNPADEAPIAITTGDRTLHCWVKRLASKVTVAFDGSALFNDVQIYISSIQLKDVPRSCPLGMDNVPGDGQSEGVTREDIESYLFPDGDKVIINDIKPEDERYLMPDTDDHVCRDAHRYLGKGDEGQDPQILVDRHSGASAQTLFFYENLQGTGRSKHQTTDGTNLQFPDYQEPENATDPLPEGWKDEKPYGTYVEVKGYYKCKTIDNRLGSGPITYRFMLGQDVDNDYNSLRNTHYKLTLRLKGYGNDADWHIVYKEHTGIYADTPVFVSYLYNQRATIPIKVIGELNPENPYLYATVASPEKYGDLYETGGGAVPEEVQYQVTETADGSWWRPWSDPRFESFPDTEEPDDDGRPGYYKGQYGADPGSTTQAVDGPWTGFLSLRPSNLIRLNDGINQGSSYEGDKTTTELRNYFLKNYEGIVRYNNSDGEVALPNNIGNHDDHGRYSYNATADPHGNKTNIWTVPLYTRPKELITKTGFTGNNPYTNYVRKTTVRYSVQFKDLHWEHIEVDVIQVPRIENPKGVWRKEGSREPFHVTLMHKNADNSYTPMTSYGEWSAQVLGDAGVISLTSTSAGSGTNASQAYANRIEGARERPVDFKINFTGKKGNAVVLVRYNGYTCEHEILCKTGYDDVKLTDEADAPVWSNFNVFRFNGDVPVMTNSPAEEGSLFRRGSRTAILASNQFRPEGNFGFPGLGRFSSDIGKFHVIKSDAEYSPDSDPKPAELSWGDCEEVTDRFNTWTIGGTEYRVATISDFYTITDLPEKTDRSKLVGKRYGILYADGATSTSSDADASQYERTLSGRSKKGMRGVIVYNLTDYRQLFLPIGALGYGRRKGATSGWIPVGESYDRPGTLRYATRTLYMPDDDCLWQPFFYDLFKRPGAIYWCKDRHSSVTIGTSSAFDINYFSMGFEGFMNGACSKANSTKTSDACFLRLVRK